MISQEKLKILTYLQKLPKNVEDLGKLIVALKSCPKSYKSPNLVTLHPKSDQIRQNLSVKAIFGAFGKVFLHLEEKPPKKS